MRDVKIKSISKSLIEGTGEEGAEKPVKKFIEKNTRWEPGAWQLDAATTNTLETLQLTMCKYVEEECKANHCTNTDNNHVPACCHKTIRNRDKNNLSKEELVSLKQLKTNSNIIIKPADKGGATVIMDIQAYEAEAMRQLNNSNYYTQIPSTLAPTNVIKIKEILDKIYNKKLISLAQLKYLSGPADYSLRNFYLLPKIHKDKSKWPSEKMPEGRPIVSDTNSESSRVAEYIDHYINPLSVNCFSYIKNSYDFVEQIRHTKVEGDFLLVTADIKSLYTNMNIDRMVETVEEVLRNNPDPQRPDNELVELLDYTLRNNDFSFGEKQYLQTCGTAMGKRYAPGLARIYLNGWDIKATNDFKYKPEFWRRFLDDIFFIWKHGTEKLREFEIYLNTLIPGIEISFEVSRTEIPFLDVMLYVQDGTIQTKTYFKPTDTHQLLHTQSYHPTHTCMGILKSQFIRFKKLSSTFEDYNHTCLTLYKYLINRGYTRAKFWKLKYQIWYGTTPKTNNNNNNKNDRNTLLPMVLEYSSVAQKLAKKYRETLQQNDKLAKLNIITAYKIAPNLKKILVRSKFRGGRHEERTGGKFTKCTSIKCQMCTTYSDENSRVRSSTNGQSFLIKHRLNCNSANIIYLISCKKCAMQYIGETGRRLRDRLNDHCSAIRTQKPTAIAIHFNSENHTITDLKITAIEQNKTWRDEDRKASEKHWITKINSAYPYGLNNWPV